jgi:hypothetical protein
MTEKNTLGIASENVLRLVAETNLSRLGDWFVIEEDEKGETMISYPYAFKNRAGAVAYANTLLEEEETLTGIEHERFI